MSVPRRRPSAIQAQKAFAWLKERADRPWHYGTVAEVMGAPCPSWIGVQLGVIHAYCVLHGLPPLNAIVVAKTGLPSCRHMDGDAAKVREEQRRVHAYPWREVPTPSAEALWEAWESRRDRAKRRRRGGADATPPR